MTDAATHTRPPLSILDLAPIAGSSATQALRNSLDLAQHAERLGYVRHWFAEHHGMPSIASSTRRASRNSSPS